MSTAISPTSEPALAAAAGAFVNSAPTPLTMQPLTMQLTLNGLLVFPRRRSVLALAVVPVAPLLRLHRAVHQALDDGGHGADVVDTTRPGAWMPHVTLARGLRAPELAAALALLSEPVDATRLSVTAVAVRRWDALNRRDWQLGSPSLGR